MDDGRGKPIHRIRGQERHARLIRGGTESSSSLARALFVRGGNSSREVSTRVQSFPRPETHERHSRLLPGGPVTPSTRPEGPSLAFDGERGRYADPIAPRRRGAYHAGASAPTAAPREKSQGNARTEPPREPESRAPDRVPAEATETLHRRVVSGSVTRVRSPTGGDSRELGPCRSVASAGSTRVLGSLRTARDSFPHSVRACTSREGRESPSVRRGSGRDAATTPPPNKGPWPATAPEERSAGCAWETIPRTGYPSETPRAANVAELRTAQWPGRGLRRQRDRTVVRRDHRLRRWQR